MLKTSPFVCFCRGQADTIGLFFFTQKQLDQSVRAPFAGSSRSWQDSNLRFEECDLKFRVSYRLSSYSNIAICPFLSWAAIYVTPPPFFKHKNKAILAFRGTYARVLRVTPCDPTLLTSLFVPFCLGQPYAFKPDLSKSVTFRVYQR